MAFFLFHSMRPALFLVKKTTSTGRAVFVDVVTKPRPISLMPRRQRAAHHCPAQTSFADLLFEPELTGAGMVAETPATAPVWAAGPLAGLVPVYGVKLVRVGSVTLSERPKLHRPADVVQLLEKHLHGADREHLVVVLLDIKNGVIGATTVSVGDLSSTIVHPREVFKPAILANAASILLCHNHPSGDTTPSPQDLAVTSRIADAGALLGIDVVDHIIIGGPGRFVSLRERGMCNFPTSADFRTGEASRSAGLTP